MSVTATPTSYDSTYYATSLGEFPYCRDGHWLAFFGGVAREIVRALAPRTVFDAGCAMGMLVESLWDLGVEARGVDISEYAIAEIRPDMRPFCTVGSVTDPLPAPVDLVTCIEVLEHVSAEDADRAIASMTAATDVVLFSSTPTDFVEPTHVNVRPPIAWIKTFGEHGFRPDIRFDGTFLSPHAILFRRGTERDRDATDELYAYHLLLRAALIEREQRLGRIEADRAREFDRLQHEHAAAVAALREDQAGTCAALRAQDAAAASEELERFRERAHVTAMAARAEVAAARRAEREAAGRANEAKAVLAAAAQGVASGERREALAYERIASLSADNARLRALLEHHEDAAEAFDALARRLGDLQARYRRLVEADVTLFDRESERLMRF